MKNTVEQKEKKGYAIIETGGKQYIVSVGDKLKIEKTSDDAKEGDIIEVSNVLLTDDGAKTTVGAPYVSSKVTAKILEVAKQKKVTVIKYKSKSRYFVKRGHRQILMKVEILSI